jgi:hypothetical protein
MFSLLKRSAVFSSCVLGVTVVLCFAGIVSAQTAGDAETGPAFRTESSSVAGGELLTIFSRRIKKDGDISDVAETPLFSVFKDTLDDNDPSNDRLRYIWLLTYTEPGFWQKAASAVPFLYSRTGNKGSVGSGPPPPLIDLNRPNPSIWDQVFWIAFKRIIVNDLSIAPRSSILQYRQNSSDHKKAAIAGALALLTVYQDAEKEQILSERDIYDIRAKLMLDNKPFGSRMQSENFDRLVKKEIALTRDYRGHNWELLRQHTEQQGLIFDPVEMPDGSATHAIVWADRDELRAGRGKKFDGRFLNFRDPWTDPSLKVWDGYMETRWYDDEDREVDHDHPNARARTLIPLAVYGLDNPKIPVILVDFRNNKNPKFREMSRRVLNDVTGNVLSLSKFSSMPYFLGRFLLDFTTSRRGTDFNQESRRRSYAQLKTLLALDESLSVPLREEMAKRVESSTLNPRQNDLDVELRIAQEQYRNLIVWASRPDGLAKRIQNDRREEIARLKSGTASRTFHSFLSFLTFGNYKQRKDASPQNLALISRNRSLKFHERIVRETAARSVRPEIDSDLAELRRSLDFLADQGEMAGSKTARALAMIFRATRTPDLRERALAGLYRINNPEAKSQLLAIYSTPDIDDHWRVETARYLRQARTEGQKISERDSRTIAGLLP